MSGLATSIVPKGISHFSTVKLSRQRQGLRSKTMPHERSHFFIWLEAARLDDDVSIVYARCAYTFAKK